MQVTLSENVHKFVELSQRIVVEKSVIEKYEEETTRNTLNRIRSTQEISTQKYNQTAMMTTSSSSSNIVGKLSTSSSVDKLIGIERNKIASSTLLAPTTTTTTTTTATTTSASLPITDTDGGGVASAIATAAVATDTASDNKNDGEIKSDDKTVHEGNNLQRTNRKTEESITSTTSSSLSTTMTLKQKNFFSSKIMKSNSTNGGMNEDAVKINADHATEPVRSTNNVTKACDVLNVNISTITKLPPPEVTMQRPLKPQSEMDFAVPYNIINNYFSVGVVSEQINHTRCWWSCVRLWRFPC